MKAELKDKWLTGLRDGSHKQGMFELRSDEDHFCCLGVLLDVAGCEWRLNATKARYNTSSFGGDSEACSLTPQMCATLGLTYDSSTELIGQNDDGRDFTEIADWIEANVPAE